MTDVEYARVFVKPCAAGSLATKRGKSRRVQRIVSGECSERDGRLLWRVDGQRLTLVQEGVQEIVVFDLPPWILPETAAYDLATTGHQYVSYLRKDADGKILDALDLYWPSE